MALKEKGKGKTAGALLAEMNDQDIEQAFYSDGRKGKGRGKGKMSSGKGKAEKGIRLGLMADKWSATIATAPSILLPIARMPRAVVKFCSRTQALLMLDHLQEC